MIKTIIINMIKTKPSVGLQSTCAQQVHGQLPVTVVQLLVITGSSQMLKGAMNIINQVHIFQLDHKEDYLDSKYTCKSVVSK